MATPLILGVSAVEARDEADMIEEVDGDHYELWIGDFENRDDADAYRSKLVEALEDVQCDKDIAFRVSNPMTPGAWKPGTKAELPISVEQAVKDLTQDL